MGYAVAASWSRRITGATSCNHAGSSPKKVLRKLVRVFTVKESVGNLPSHPVVYLENLPRIPAGPWGERSARDRLP